MFIFVATAVGQACSIGTKVKSASKVFVSIFPGVHEQELAVTVETLGRTANRSCEEMSTFFNELFVALHSISKITPVLHRNILTQVFGDTTLTTRRLLDKAN